MKIDIWKKQLKDLKKKIRNKGFNNISIGQKMRIAKLEGLIKGWYEEAKRK